MAILIGRNTRVEVQKTLATAFVVTDISKSNPGVASITGTGPTNGQVVILDDELEGMTELAGQVARAAANAGSPTEFELESINTTNYGTFSGPSSGQTVTEWSTLGKARNVSQGTAAANRLDATVLLDNKKKFVFAQSDDPEITIDGLSDLLSEASLIIEEAAENNTPLVFRITLSDGSKRIFRGYVTLPTENIPLGDLLTSGFSVTQIGKRLKFAS